MEFSTVWEYRMIDFEDSSSIMEEESDDDDTETEVETTS